LEKTGRQKYNTVKGMTHGPSIKERFGLTQKVNGKKQKPGCAWNPHCGGIHKASPNKRTGLINVPELGRN